MVYGVGNDGSRQPTGIWPREHTQHRGEPGAPGETDQTHTARLGRAGAEGGGRAAAWSSPASGVEQQRQTGRAELQLWYEKTSSQDSA